MKKTCLALLLSMVSFGQVSEDKSGKAVVHVYDGFSQQEPSVGSSSVDLPLVNHALRFYSVPVRVEIAGFDSHGKPYIVVNGSRKKCSRKQWIKFVVSSLLIDEGVKDQALIYIGAPRNVQVMGEVK